MERDASAGTEEEAEEARGGERTGEQWMGGWTRGNEEGRREIQRMEGGETKTIRRGAMEPIRRRGVNEMEGWWRGGREMLKVSRSFSSSAVLSL